MSPAFRPRPGVVASRQGEARYLTDTATGKVFELNEPALRIFEALGRGEDEAALLATLRAAYPGVSPAELARDARALLEELVRAGLVEPRS